MRPEFEQSLSENNFRPREVKVGISDPSYLKSLSWGKKIKVTNFIPTIQYENNDFKFFRNNYLERQLGLIKRLEVAGSFIANNDLQTPEDVKPQHKEFLRGFVQDIGIFFSKTLFFSLNSKETQSSLFEELSKKYPHIESDLLITPSQFHSSIIKMLKIAEYSREENKDFALIFCGGNFDLANKFKNSLSLEEENQIREKIIENTIKKGYAMLGRRDIQLLDDLLVIDNTLESWIWRESVATAPLFHIYNLMQETIKPTGSFTKENGYTFDLKLIRDNF